MSTLILVLDDSQDMLTLYQSVFGDEGYVVSTQSHIPHDLELIKQLNPDLAIVDLIFNNEELGWELIEKMKQDSRTAHIPIILCTAYLDNMWFRAVELKKKKILVVIKPFNIDALLDATRKSLQPYN